MDGPQGNERGMNFEEWADKSGVPLDHDGKFRNEADDIPQERSGNFNEPPQEGEFIDEY